MLGRQPIVIEHLQRSRAWRATTRQARSRVIWAWLLAVRHYAAADVECASAAYSLPPALRAYRLREQPGTPRAVRMTFRSFNAT